MTLAGGGFAALIAMIQAMANGFTVRTELSIQNNAFFNLFAVRIDFNGGQIRLYHSFLHILLPTWYAAACSFLLIERG